jgi:hypothetical protein
VEILVVLIMALVVVAYVGYPFWSQKEEPSTARRPAQAAPGPIAPDMDELDLDREAGRLEADDYASLKQTAESAVSGADRTDDEIERRVRALRARRARARDGTRSGKR